MAGKHPLTADVPATEKGRPRYIFGPPSPPSSPEPEPAPRPAPGPPLHVVPPFFTPSFPPTANVIAQNSLLGHSNLPQAGSQHFGWAASLPPPDNGVLALRANASVVLSSSATETKSATFPKSVRGFNEARSGREKGKWVLRGTVPTEQVLFWFEREPQDFKKYLDGLSSAVTMTHAVAGGTAPLDWRARPFVLRWNNSISEAEKMAAIQDNRLVATASYKCKGKHRFPENEEQQRLFRKKARELPHNAIRSKDTAGREGSEPESGSTSAGNANASTSQSQEVYVSPPRGQECKQRTKGNVMISVEIYSTNLDLALIYQYGKHSDVDVQAHQRLDPSKRIKNWVEIRLDTFSGLTFAATISSIQKDLRPVFQDYTKPPEQFCPEFRIPEQNQLRNWGSSARSRSKKDDDPLRAVDRVVDKYPDNIFCHRRILDTSEGTDSGEELFDEEEAKLYKKFALTEFTIGLKDNFTMECVIIWAPINGLSVDSSYRNKNEARAPIFFLGTAARKTDSDIGCFLPGGAVLSERSSTYACVRIFASYEKAIMRFCDELVNGKVKPIHTRPELVQQLMNHAKLFLEAGRMVLAFIMTDKCLAQINAAALVFPNVPIRICQFHVVQALYRWQTDTGKRINAPQLPASTHDEIVQKFRELQRCRTMEEWPEFKATFYRAVNVALEKALSSNEPVGRLTDGETSDEEDGSARQRGSKVSGKTKGTSKSPEKSLESKEPNVEDSSSDDDTDSEYEPSDEEPGTTPKKPLGRRLTKTNIATWKKRICYYFSKSWFKRKLLNMFTDIGMPAGQTREGTWNVNNWMEAAFKNFDKVFLESRKNKTVARLLYIILEVQFPYYRSWAQRPEFLSAGDPPVDLRQLYDSAYEIWDKGHVEKVGAMHYRIVFPSVGPGPRNLITFLVDVEHSRCNCTGGIATGKLCVHLHAAELRHKIGDPMELDAQGARENRESMLSNRQNMEHLEKRLAAANATSVNPKRYKLKPKHFYDDGDDRHPQQKPQRDRFLSDSLVNARVLSVLSTARQLPSSLSKPTKANANITPLQTFRSDHSAIYKEILKKNGKKGFIALRHKMAESQQAITRAACDCSELDDGDEQAVLKAPEEITDDGNPYATWDTKRGFVSLDLRRWFHPEYRLTSSEANMFVDILNGVAHTLNSKFLFVNPTKDLFSRLLSLDWSAVPGSANEEDVLFAPLERQGLKPRAGGAPDSILLLREANRRRQTLEKIVFWHLDNAVEGAEHWVLFVYDIAADSFTCYQSLKSNVSVDIWGETVIAKFLTTRLHPGPRRVLRKYPTIKLACQKDGRSCGWWCGWEGFGLLFDQPLEQKSHFLKVSASTIIHGFQDMLQFYLGDEGGLKFWVICQTFNAYCGNALQGLGLELPDTICIRRRYSTSVSSKEMEWVTMTSRMAVYVLQNLQAPEIMMSRVRLGIRPDDIQDVSGKVPLSPGMFSASVSSVCKVMSANNLQKHLVVDVKTSKRMAKALTDGLCPATTDGATESWFSELYDGNVQPIDILIPFLEDHASIVRITVATRTVTIVMARSCPAAMENFKAIAKGIIAYEAGIALSPLSGVQATDEWTAEVFVPDTMCAIHMRDERRWVLLFLLDLMNGCLPGQGEWGQLPLLQAVRLLPSYICCAELVPSGREELLSVAKRPSICSNSPKPNEGHLFMHQVADGFYPSQVVGYDEYHDLITCRYMDEVKEVPGVLDPFPHFCIPASDWSCGEPVKYRPNQIGVITKSSRLVRAATQASCARVWPLLGSLVDPVVSLIAGDVDLDHPYMCFLFLPGVGDAKIGAAWEDGLCQLLAPCDIATIKEFVSSAFPKVLGSAQYVKICRFLGISTLLLELRQRPHHAHLTPEKLVDIIQRGGYLDRSNYFDDIWKLVKSGCDNTGGESLEACIEIREDIDLPWLDLYLPNQQSDPDDPPNGEAGSSTIPEVLLSPSARSPDPTREGILPPEAPSAGSFIARLVNEDALTTASQLSKHEPTTTVLQVGAALPNFVSAGALHRLRSPTMLFDDEVLNGFIASLEPGMATKRCFIFSTSLDKRIKRFFHKVQNNDSWYSGIDFFDYDRLVVPVLEYSDSGCHYYVNVVDIPSKQVQCYNSRTLHDGTLATIHSVYLNWLETRWNMKPERSKTPFDQTQWGRRPLTPAGVPEPGSTLNCPIQCAAVLWGLIEGMLPTAWSNIEWKEDDARQWRDFMTTRIISEGRIPNGLLQDEGEEAEEDGIGIVELRGVQAEAESNTRVPSVGRPPTPPITVTTRRSTRIAKLENTKPPEARAKRPLQHIDHGSKKDEPQPKRAKTAQSSEKRMHHDDSDGHPTSNNQAISNPKRRKTGPGLVTQSHIDSDDDQDSDNNNSGRGDQAEDKRTRYLPTKALWGH